MRVSPVDGLKVLCIDNEAAILDGMRALLSGWGCVVGTAADAPGAMKLIRDSGGLPDAVVADFHLDRSDGLGAIRQLRKAFGQDLKAVLLTADRTAELREKAERIGVTVLNKPLKPAALRAWLSQAGIRRQAAE